MTTDAAASPSNAPEPVPGPSRRHALAWMGGALPLLSGPARGAEATPRPSVGPIDADRYYPAGFRLPPLRADAIPRVARPPVKSPGLDAPSYVDPVYGTRIYRVTAPADFTGASFVRHDYSRRQPFNADHTRFIAEASNGYWLLYDAQRFDVLRRGGHAGALRGLAGDCEALWHPTDPRKLWYTATNGGLVWWEKDVEADIDQVLMDFRGRLPWPDAKSVWTKGEGRASADGRLFAFMATSYHEASKKMVIHGLFTYDRSADRILGTLDAGAFGGVFPDHISISPSGRYAVPSWAYQPQLGTRAYPLDFSSHRLLHPDSEHSDMALGPDGQDYFIAASYKDGMLWAKDLATGQRLDLMRLYPRRGASIGALHVSGLATQRRGWILVSTYGDSADYGKTKPDPELHAAHRKLMLLELKPNGRQYSVTHTHAGVNYGGYEGEHQAAISRDGTRILFASNFDDGPPSSYLVLLPGSVYA